MAVDESGRPTLDIDGGFASYFHHEVVAIVDHHSENGRRDVCTEIVDVGNKDPAITELEQFVEEP